MNFNCDRSYINRLTGCLNSHLFALFALSAGVGIMCLKVARQADWVMRD